MSIAESDFQLSQLKGELDAALIVMETKLGLNHAHPQLIGVREAADKLFAGALRRKFTAIVPERRLNYRELVESGAFQRGREH